MAQLAKARTVNPLFGWFVAVLELPHKHFLRRHSKIGFPKLEMIEGQTLILFVYRNTENDASGGAHCFPVAPVRSVACWGYIISSSPSICLGWRRKHVGEREPLPLGRVGEGSINRIHLRQCGEPDEKRNDELACERQGMDTISRQAG